MFRQVLVPVKFSVCGRLAARHACDVARAIGGTLTLLHVLEYSAPGPPELENFEVYLAHQEEALALLRQVGLYARRPPGFLIVPALNSSAPDSSTLAEPILNRPILTGPAPNGVASAILKVAAETGAELIMLGLRSHGGPVQGVLGQGALGQVVGPVLLGAGVPVQVTPFCPTPGVATGVQSGGWRGVLAGRD